MIKGPLWKLLSHLNSIPWPQDKAPYVLAKREYENDFVLYGESDKHDLEIEKIEGNVRVIMQPTRREFVAIRNIFQNKQMELFKDVGKKKTLETGE